MSKKPVLVIMAAGMGSRYGGLKQIDPVDPYGNMIIDFSIYDAVRAGFKKVIFIIKKENEADFRESIGNRMSTFMMQNRQALRKSSLSSKKPSTRHSARASASELRNTWM